MKPVLLEQWVPVKGYEGYYEVSNQGRVRSVTREVYHGNGTNRKAYGRIIRARNDGSGYPCVGLHKDGITFHAKVHRLVCFAYVNNPEQKPEVNHLDENKQNNEASNLEWCTRKENENYGTKHARSLAHTDYKAIARKNAKRVAQYTLSGDHIKTWGSLAEMSADTGYSIGNVSMCCTGKYENKLYGYRWAYV